jgi:uncharacterized protein with GYD domain
LKDLTLLKAILCDKVIFYVFYPDLMSFYIILWNYTDQGIKNVKESPKRADAFKSKLENAGGKLIETYYTFGKYDGISVVEAPNDEALMSCLLSIESQGNARTITLKAFSYDEATKIIENIQQ